MRRVGAIVLCGGQSRRMGRPKEFLQIGRETFLSRVVRSVAERSEIVVISAAEGRLLPPLPGGIVVEVVRDPTRNRGPLQGIASGMVALGDRVDWAFVCATDAPMIESAWIGHLLDAESPEVDLILPRVDGRDQPLAALYRPGPTAREAALMLASGEFRLSMLAARLRRSVLSEDHFRSVDPGFRTLKNINTPEDYCRLIREEGSSTAEPRPEGRDES